MRLFTSVGIFGQNLLKGIDRLLRGLEIFGGRQARDDILRESRGEEGFGRRQLRVEIFSILKVSDGLFVLSGLEGFDSLIELVAGFQFVAAGKRNHHGHQNSRKHRQTCDSIHILILLLRVVARFSRLVSPRGWKRWETPDPAKFLEGPMQIPFQLAAVMLQ